jgi:hypothetical protein
MPYLPGQVLTLLFQCGVLVLRGFLCQLSRQCTTTHDFHKLVKRKSRFLPNILHFVPVNNRLCWIRVLGKFRNYSIINAHAPTEDKDDEEKDNFYLELETAYSPCPKHDIKMVLGDFNAKWARKQIIIPMLEEMDCMGNVMETGINWYSLPPQRI